MPYQGIIAETVAFTGLNSDTGEAYLARPQGAGPFPGVVLIHHMPGWDEWTMPPPGRAAPTRGAHAGARRVACRTRR
jgi:carboxymethylenebutenolidase